MSVFDELSELAYKVESSAGGCGGCIARGEDVSCKCEDSFDCTDAICAEVSGRLREIVERDACDVTTVSAYDLLPDEDRKAIAWVREHGGIAEVKDAVKTNEWALSLAIIAHDALFGEDSERDTTPTEFKRELDKRMVPPGMEWPRFEDGEPVRPIDKLLDKDGDWFEAVSFAFTCDWWSIRGYQTEGFGDLNDNTRRSLEGMAYGTRVKRPAPKDSWERLEKDAEKHVCKYFCHSDQPQPPGCGHDVRSCRFDMQKDLVRRAKALAGDA